MMKLRPALLLLTLLTFSFGYSQNKPAYVLYNNKGKKVSYKKLVKCAEKSNIVLFGEQHNNTISHWLQLELTQKLGEKNELILGAEMLEQDNQDELNDYLNGTIDAEAFDTLARLWINYSTDYAPLVDCAKENNLPFIATNIPRRFANLVYKKGVAALDTLSDEELSWIAPLPFPYDSTLPTYQKIIEMMGEHGSPALVKAQAIKDATMAHSIAPYLSDSTTFIHYNGAFHSDYYEGILWYLNQYAESFTALTISTVTQANVRKLEKEHVGKADFIICVDEDVTTTY
ncbi:MAG: ChaN family lipoprotein [Crocinitomicaceae bacterium]|nr:ChaN family lipoprotein [Crocinitomicaceae bacterium]